MAKLTKAEKQARWVALPIAYVERPLRYLKEKLTSIEIKEDGSKVSVLDPRFGYLKAASKYGCGDVVQAEARHYVNTGKLKLLATLS